MSEQTVKCKFGVSSDKLPVDLVRLNVATELYASYETFQDWNNLGLPIYEMGRRISFVSISETEAFIRKNATVKAGQS